MTQKQRENRIGSIIQYNKIRFGILDFFISIETSILNNNLKFAMEVMSVFSLKNDSEIIATKEEFAKSLTKNRS